MRASFFSPFHPPIASLGKIKTFLLRIALRNGMSAFSPDQIILTKSEEEKKRRFC